MCYCLEVTAVDPEQHTMLLFERFDSLSKDPVIFPYFNSQVAEAMPEQMLRTAVISPLSSKTISAFAVTIQGALLFWGLNSGLNFA